MYAPCSADIESNVGAPPLPNPSIFRADSVPQARTAGGVADFLSYSAYPAAGTRKVRIVSASCAVSSSFRYVICADLCAKHASFTALDKVMSFVFSHFLALFPLFLLFRALLRVPSFQAISKPVPLVTVPVTLKTSGTSESSISASNARIKHWFGLNFEFVLSSFSMPSLCFQ